MKMRDNNSIRLYGSTVVLREGDDINRALKKFKNKIEEGGKLKDLQRKEFYEKPTTTRKRKAGAAKARWNKKLKDQQLPKKLY
jgi:small subunit ribosomal protein S21